jgi:hypothetical protein
MQHMIGKVRRPRRRRGGRIALAWARGGAGEPVRQVLRGGRVQTKLKVGAPNDAYEQEADRVADRVMGLPEPAVDVAPAPLGVQRACAACEEEAVRRQPLEEEEEVQAKGSGGPTPEIGPGLQSRIKGLRGGGEPLAPAARAFFEPRFGADFGQVRIHADGSAAALAQSINARAFTFGRNVAFGAGEYQPETSEGRHLIAHELTHVVQQGGRRLSHGTPASPGTDSQRSGAVVQRADKETEGSSAETPFEAAPSDRHNYAFIMGTEGAYRMGTWFAQTYYSGSHSISHGASLCAVLTQIAEHSGTEVQPDGTTVRGVGQVVIISHAKKDGRFLFPVNDSDTDNWVTPDEISNLLSQQWLETTSIGCRQAALTVAQSSDAGTRVIVKGCNLGQNQAAVDALRQLFGGEATVTAPKRSVRMQNVGFGPRVPGRRTVSEAIAWMVTNGFLPPEANTWSEERKTEFIDALWSENAEAAGLVGIPAEFLVIEGREVLPSDPAYQENIAVSKPEATGIE